MPLLYVLSIGHVHFKHFFSKENPHEQVLQHRVHRLGIYEISILQLSQCYAYLSYECVHIQGNLPYH